MKLTVNEKVYPVKFGFGALRILCKKWNETKVSGLDKHFAKLDLKEGEEYSFKQFDLFADLAMAGLERANKKVVFDADDVLDALLSDTSKLNEFMQLVMDSMPKNNEPNPEKRGNV